MQMSSQLVTDTTGSTHFFTLKQEWLNCTERALYPLPQPGGFSLSEIIPGAKASSILATVCGATLQT